MQKMSAAKNILQCRQILLEKMSVIVKKMNRAIEEEEGELSRDLMVIHEFTSEDSIIKELKDKYDRLFRLIRGASNTLYGISEQPVTMEDFYGRKEMLNHYASNIIPVDGIECYLEQDAIYIRLPMLWSRNNGKRSSKRETFFVPEMSKMYRESVDAAIRLTGNYSPESFADYEYKTFQYTFLYHKSGEYVCVDTDNHETKAVTDAVAGFLPNGDSARYASFVERTTFSDDISAGTYLTVIPGEFNVYSIEEIIDYWRNKGKGNASL